MQTQIRKFAGPRFQAVDIFFRQIDNIRYQQHLRGHILAGQRGFEPFVNKPLMGGMLIDNDQTVPGLRDNIIFMNLGAGDPKRKIGICQLACWHLHRSGVS